MLVPADSMTVGASAGVVMSATARSRAGKRTTRIV